MTDSPVSAWSRTLTITGGPGFSAAAQRDPGVVSLAGTVTLSGLTSPATVTLEAAAWADLTTSPPDGAWYTVPGSSTALGASGSLPLGSATLGAAPVPVTVPAARLLRARLVGGGSGAALSLVLTADDY